MADHIIVLVTAPSADEGRSVAKALVEARLCACVNMIEGVKSTFRWQGEVQEEDEVLLVCKGREKDFPEIEKKVKEHHSYTVPEVIALHIQKGYNEYLDWITRETAR